MAPELEHREVMAGDGTRALLVCPRLEWLTDALDFRELLLECVDARSHVLIDLAGVDGVDSMGLGLLARVARELSRHERRLILFAPTDNVRRLLEITGAQELLTVVADRASAIALLEQSDNAQRSS